MPEVNKQQPGGQISPQPPIFVAHELRMVFIFLNGWGGKTSKGEEYFVAHDHHIRFKFHCLSTKFDWNTATLMHLYVVRECFCVTIKKVSCHYRGCMT